MLTLQFIPHSQIEHLGSARRVKKLLDLVKQDKIVLLEGRLREQEEKDLIEITMEEIDNKFKGIELSVIYPDNRSNSLLKKLKHGMIKALLGYRQGLTIIGPASIVKEIKKDPEKIELLTVDKKVRKKSKR